LRRGSANVNWKVIAKDLSIIGIVASTQKNIKYYWGRGGSIQNSVLIGYWSIPHLNSKFLLQQDPLSNFGLVSSFQ